jgi:hypothetical protein
LKLRWVNEQRHSKRLRDTGHRWGAERPENSPYKPSFKRPRYASCREVYIELSRHFKVQDKGPVQSFLGINIMRDWEKHLISINQPRLIDRMLARFNMVNAKIAKTPLEFGVHLVKANPNNRMCDIKLYQELVGSLNHLAVFTRPDIAFSVSMLSQFNSNPTQTHWKAAL